MWCPDGLQASKKDPSAARWAVDLVAEVRAALEKPQVSQKPRFYAAFFFRPVFSGGNTSNIQHAFLFCGK